MSESLNNQGTKQDTKNGFTVLMGLKERNEKEKEPGCADQTGRRGTRSPFSVPSTSPMISAEYRRSVAAQAIRCRLRLESGCTGVTVEDLGEGLLSSSSVISKQGVFADYLRCSLTGN